MVYILEVRRARGINCPSSNVILRVVCVCVEAPLQVFSVSALYAIITPGICHTLRVSHLLYHPASPPSAICSTPGGGEWGGGGGLPSVTI